MGEGVTKECDWTLNNYIKLSRMKYPSKAKFLCVKQNKGMKFLHDLILILYISIVLEDNINDLLQPDSDENILPYRENTVLPDSKNILPDNDNIQPDNNIISDESILPEESVSKTNCISK